FPLPNSPYISVIACVSRPPPRSSSRAFEQVVSFATDFRRSRITSPVSKPPMSTASRAAMIIFWATFVPISAASATIVGEATASLSFDRVATIYDATRGLAPRAMARVLGVLVDELHRKRVLEVGVGTGRYAVPLQKSGIRVVGVDISRSMVEFGLAKGLRDVVFADGAHLPFRRHAFDAATTNHVLHLIADWRDVLIEIARVTREMYFSII